MSKEALNESICLKKYLSEKDYGDIKQLEELVLSNDKTNLKLELEYRMNIVRNPEAGLKDIDEFLYYIDDKLAAYLSISCFGRNIGEISGMTHPAFRRKGLFSRLFRLAKEESAKRNFSKLLLLSDAKSDSGIAFINSAGGIYDFSEYHMQLTNPPRMKPSDVIALRKAGIEDRKEIKKQDAIFFDDVDEDDSDPSEIDGLNEVTYMAEQDGMVIGKIKIEYNDDFAYIFGFGILPEFRGKGCGRAVLGEALRFIQDRSINKVILDVECKNNTALNLYKSYGFQEVSVMNYYKL